MAEYLNNKHFKALILAYRAEPTNANRDALYGALKILAEHIVRGFNFHLLDPQDAVQDSIVIAWQKVGNYDPAKGNSPFNYLTTVILNNLRQLHRQTKNYNNLKRKLTIRAFERTPQSAFVRALRHDLASQTDES